MTALLYLVVAVLAAALPTRAWLADREDTARRAFLGLGWCISLAYGAFGLSLVPGLVNLRVLYLAAGCSTPAFSLWCVDTLFSPEGERAPSVSRLAVVTAVLVPTAVVAHLALFADLPRSSPAEILAGLFAYAAFALTIGRLVEAHEAMELQVDKVRLRYLIAVAALAVVLTVVEQAARNLAAPVDPYSLPISSRGVVLQGAIPPFSLLFVALALYFLYQILVMYRLIDVHELYSRVATLLVLAVLLVSLDGVTVMWVDTFSTYPVHGTFQVFLASVLFLAAYDPLKGYVSWWANRLFNQRGQQLAETLTVLRGELPTLISAQGAAETLLSRLHGSGRVHACSVYLWDRSLDAFACVGVRSADANPPLKAVPAHPFTDGFIAGQPWYLRSAVARQARNDATMREVLSLMEAMYADLTVPFMAGESVLGWMHLRDEPWSDGFSVLEMQGLREVGNAVGVVLSNVQGFEALEEKQRLAALGAMAAGLAHEIRNPLAGIKGAAQYLQTEALPEEAEEMLQVVVDETDRLNVVVSEFLDYARPTALELSEDHVNAIATHALSVLKAQGLPDGVAVDEDLAGDLPTLRLDRARLSQVLLNLLQNALQAMPDGGTLGLTTRMRLDGRGQYSAEIAITDTGKGIEPEAMDQLFTPFFTTRREGTGLGLAISQRIVREHGGELDVQSVPGRGATFVVRLPLMAG